MNKCYFETRTVPKPGKLDLAADIVRHLHARQYVGKSLVICDRPAEFLSDMYRQWLKLSRIMQRQRTNSLSADKILKYTRAITHMQHVRFSAKTPLEDPEADVYFLSPEQVAAPVRCFSVYVATPLGAQPAAALLAQLPADALVVDYTQSAFWEESGLQPKQILNDRVRHEWYATQAFLSNCRIDVQELANPERNVEAMDDALDTLLGVAHQFLQVAESFNHTLELARPLRLGKATREQYDTFALLAHRVQALTNVGFSHRFLETYNEDDSFFLYDGRAIRLRRGASLGLETLAQAIAGHLQAERNNLARALQACA